MEGDNVCALRRPFDKCFGETLPKFNGKSEKINFVENWEKIDFGKKKLTSLVSNSIGSGSVFCQN